MMLPPLACRLHDRDAGGASTRGIDNTFIDWETMQANPGTHCTFSPHYMHALWPEAYGLWFLGPPIEVPSSSLCPSPPPIVSMSLLRWSDPC